MTIDQLTTRFKSLKKLCLGVLARPWTRELELSEEDIIESFTKICRNLVNLESLEVSIKR